MSTNIIILLSTLIGGEEMSDKKKAGRPFSENPTAVKLTVRVDNDTVKILDDYCLRNNISRADGVREGIKALKDK